jgi:hypothetical protein
VLGIGPGDDLLGGRRCLVAQMLRDAEHQREHPQRQLLGAARDQLDVPGRLTGEPVDNLLGRHRYLVLDAPDLLRGERLGDQPA